MLRSGTPSDSPPEARQGTPEWPASPWTCAAPESYLLLHFRKHEAKQALKLGVVELLARRWLVLKEVTESRWFGRSRKDSALMRAKSHTEYARAKADLPLTLGALFDVFEETPQTGANGALVSQFARHTVKTFGSVDGYVSKAVRPALYDRGWASEDRYKVMGLFPAKRWTLTQAGMAAQADLLWRVEYGNRALGKLVDDDPVRAVAFLGLSGAAVLLMDDARPHLKRLREQLEAGARERDGTGSDAAVGMYIGMSAMGMDSGAGTAALDAGSTWAGLDALDGGLVGLDNLDLSALDSLDTAFDAVDAGVDAGASSSDGGSSGGDGGGGGGGD